MATGVDATDYVRMRFLFIEKEELVGIESTSRELVKKLVGGPSTRLVISLVGEGRIVKTTLTNNVYDDEAVQGHLDCHAWITGGESTVLKN